MRYIQRVYSVSVFFTFGTDSSLFHDQAVKIKEIMISTHFRL